MTDRKDITEVSTPPLKTDRHTEEETFSPVKGDKYAEMTTRTKTGGDHAEIITPPVKDDRATLRSLDMADLLGGRMIAENNRGTERVELHIQIRAPVHPERTDG